MGFQLEGAIEILENTPKVLHAYLCDLSKDWLYTNEGVATWSPYDILGHLIVGEKTDWMVRTKIILGDTESKVFEPFDRFAQEQEDKNRSITELLKELRQLREHNLTELKSLNLNREDLRLKGIHPELGEVSLKQLLAAWVVHDLGHISQISRVMAKQYKKEVGPWSKYLGVLNL